MTLVLIKYELLLINLKYNCFRPIKVAASGSGISILPLAAFSMGNVLKKIPMVQVHYLHFNFESNIENICRMMYYSGSKFEMTK